MKKLLRFDDNVVVFVRPLVVFLTNSPPPLHPAIHRICNRAKTKSTGPSVRGSRVTGFVLSDYVVVVVVTARWGEYDVEELCVDHLSLSERDKIKGIQYILCIERDDKHISLKNICLVHSAYILVHAVK